MTFLRKDLRVAELASQVATVAALDVAGLDSQRQARALRALSRVESSLAGLRLRLLAEAERVHTARRSGAASTGHWVAGLTHADPATPIAR